jgi:hypothetical protein
MTTERTLRNVLAVLLDPANRDLSANKLGEIGECDKRFAAGVRALAVALLGGGHGGEAARLLSALATTPEAAPDRSTIGYPTPDPPGRTSAMGIPALNSIHCWMLATEAERRKFVSAVGLRHLIAAAPEIERQAVLEGPSTLPLRPSPETDLSPLEVSGADPADMTGCTGPR